MSDEVLKLPRSQPKKDYEKPERPRAPGSAVGGVMESPIIKPDDVLPLPRSQPKKDYEKPDRARRPGLGGVIEG